MPPRGSTPAVRLPPSRRATAVRKQSAAVIKKKATAVKKAKPAKPATVRKQSAKKKATPVEKTKPKTEPAARKPPAAKKKSMPKKMFGVRDFFDCNTDVEDEMMEAALESDGWSFYNELSERSGGGEYGFSYGLQVSKAVWELVVGKPGGSVMFRAGVREDHKKDLIVVGQKGKTITAADFNKVRPW